VTKAASPYAVSVALHVVAGLFLFHLAVRLPQPILPQQTVQFDVVETPPEPKPVEPVKPLPLKIVARAPRPTVIPPPTKAPLPQTPAAPPPPTQEAPSPTPAPVIVTGITLESTSQGGSFAVGVGNTLQGTPADKAVAPAQVKPYKAETYAPAAQVTELPAPLNAESVNLRKYYPPEALHAGFEGDVVLRLLIDSDGSVSKIDIVSDPGQGLGAAAARAVRAEYRFRPAKVNGVPVATTVPFTVHFFIPD
jgi:periplasmic protein TonB